MIYKAGWSDFRWWNVPILVKDGKFICWVTDEFTMTWKRDELGYVRYT